MISNKVLDFLKSLKKNNNKEWFLANKKSYDNAKEEFEQFVAQVIIQMSLWDKDLSKLEAKKCIFRIYRDIRFSNDKTPYKTNMGAWLSRDGKLGNSAGYYINIEPEACFLSGGIYMPPADILKQVRTEIFNFNDEFKKIINAPEIKKQIGSLWQEDKLKNPPRGFDIEFEDIDLLKNKHFILTKNLSQQNITDPKFVSKTVEIFRIMQPLVRFLNRAIDENKVK